MSTTISRATGSWFSILTAAVVTGSLGAGCVASTEDTGVDESELSARPHAFDMGVNGWPGDFAAFKEFRTASHAPASEPRICHVYTYWDIAHHDPAGGDMTHTLHGLIQWFGLAEAVCDEVLVTFQGPQEQSAFDPPSVAAFEQAFVDFRDLTHAGRPLARWSGRLSFTPWNEPNNPAGSGNGLRKDISPELAAAYYLAARKRCDPSDCKVAAGDFATNGGTADDIEWNCADDNSPADTPSRCAKPSSKNPSGKAPSYLDRYKNTIANQAIHHGLPAGFRPEYFAYHPWHDVNSYIDSSTPCRSYDDCVTRRLLQSLGGSWGRVVIWDTEIGVGLQNATPPDKHTTQPCGAAFLVRLTDLSPRITRVYYMRYAGANGPLFDGPTLRPAGKVLADRSMSYAGARCADTGM